MPDPYLMAMMRGEFATNKSKSMPKKDKFDLSLEKQVNDYLDTIDFEAECQENKLVSPQMRRAQMKEELLSSMKSNELTQQIQTAISVLLSDGKQCLEEIEYRQMLEELSQIGDKVNAINLDSPPEENFQTLFNISNSTMGGIFKVAAFKFASGEFDSCLSIFMLLSTLNPGNAEYWFRLGMAAQQSKNLDLALRAYRVAAELDPQLIGAELLTADCFLRQGKREEAQGAYKAAKKIEKSSQIDPDWKELLDAIGKSLNLS